MPVRPPPSSIRATTERGDAMRRWIGERLSRGESLIGCFVSTPQLATCEVLAASGFDVLVADPRDESGAQLGE